MGRTTSTENVTLCGEHACRVRDVQAKARLVRCAGNPLRRSCVSSARDAGESEICPVHAQPSAEIARVECAICRRECDLSCTRATLCGDRACRVREMPARMRFVRCARNLLRRSYVSSARNAGENAICLVCAQPSAEIVRIECTKCRRKSDLSGPRATLLCGDRACRVREMQAKVRFVRCACNPLRRSRAVENPIEVVATGPRAFQHKIRVRAGIELPQIYLINVLFKTGSIFKFGRNVGLQEFKFVLLAQDSGAWWDQPPPNLFDTRTPQDRIHL